MTDRTILKTVIDGASFTWATTTPVRGVIPHETSSSAGPATYRYTGVKTISEMVVLVLGVVEVGAVTVKV